MGKLTDFLADYHASHDCNPGQCVCKCGCQVMMGCRAMGGLCSQCHIANNWGDEQHGFKTDAQTGELLTVEVVK